MWAAVNFSGTNFASAVWIFRWWGQHFSIDQEWKIYGLSLSRTLESNCCATKFCPQKTGVRHQQPRLSRCKLVRRLYKYRPNVFVTEVFDEDTSAVLGPLRSKPHTTAKFSNCKSDAVVRQHWSYHLPATCGYICMDKLTKKDSNPSFAAFWRHKNGPPNKVKASSTWAKWAVLKTSCDSILITWSFFLSRGLNSRRTLPFDEGMASFHYRPNFKHFGLDSSTWP